MAITLAITLVLALVTAPCTASLTAEDAATVSDAKAVLAANWVPSMNSTLPSPNLYPHQWSWDAAFVVIGYSHFHTARAIDEMDALFRAQWASGLLPHIVFNPSTAETYFPGPAFWQTNSSSSPPSHPATSGIVQPPVHAIASLAVWKNARSPQDRHLAMLHLRAIYPKLALWHRYLYAERDPHDEALVYIRHMWESGMDNSPAWDSVLEAIHLTPDMIPEYTRVDESKVGDHKERPTSFFYDRAVHLIHIFYKNSYDEAAIFKESPFLVQDVLFNSILARAGEALADIADLLDLHDDAVFHRRRSERTAAAITSKLYNPEQRFFFDYDMVADRQIPSKISGGLVALYGAKFDKEHLDAAVAELYSPAFLGKDLSSWTIPSVAMDDPAYTNTTYWTGPAWLNINYMVRDGLLRNAKGNKDAEKIAEFLMVRSIQMIKKSGFYEYFNPISGSAHGGHQFSWSAALTIDWICSSNATGCEEGTLALGSTRNTIWGGVLLALFTLLTAHRMVASRLPVSSTGVDDLREEVELLGKADKKAQRCDAHLPLPRTGTAARLRPRNRSGAHRPM